jgi:hypothetical protein
VPRDGKTSLILLVGLASDREQAADQLGISMNDFACADHDRDIAGRRVADVDDDISADGREIGLGLGGPQTRDRSESSDPAESGDAGD